MTSTTAPRFLTLSDLTPAQRIVLDDARCEFDRGMTYAPTFLHDIPAAEALVEAGIFVKVVDHTQVGQSYRLALDVFLPTNTPAPESLVVGMPVTYCINGDRYAEVVVAVERKGQAVRTFPLINGLTPEQTVEEYQKRVASGEIADYQGRRPVEDTYTRRRNGMYRPTGADYSCLYFGEARNHWDPSF